MTNIYVLLLLGLFSRASSYEKGETQFGGYGFQYWGDGEDNTPWCEAEQACIIKDNSGHLAIPKTKALNDGLFDFLAYWSSPEVFIGGNDMHTEGYWSWVDGTQLVDGYTNWVNGEPNNDHGGEHCLEFNYKPSQWNDLRCYHSNAGYVCQYDLSKATKSNYVALAFSDSFDGKSKIAASIKDARFECESRGLKLLRNADNVTAKKNIRRHLAKQPGAKYCIDDGNNGKLFGAKELLNEECAGHSFPYICEGYRPHFIKISDEAPVVEESGNVEIECTADGYPVPDVAWHKNYDYVITTDTNASVYQKRSPGKSTLVITNAKPGDADRYRCWAINNINGEERSLRINSDLKVLKNLN